MLVVKNQRNGRKQKILFPSIGLEVKLGRVFKVLLIEISVTV